MDATVRKLLSPSVDVELPVDLLNNEIVTQPFKLALNWHAVCDIAARTGKSILDGSVWEAIEKDPEFFAVAFHAALHLHHPELSLEQVKDMIPCGDWTTLAEKLAEAWKKTRPKPRPTPEPAK